MNEELLEQQAAAIDQQTIEANTPNIDQAPEIGAAPSVDLKTEFQGLLTIALGVFSPMLPSIKPIYTPEVVEAIATSAASVCNKHGWLSGGVGGKWGEEIAFCGLMIPIAIQTRKAVLFDIAAAKAKAVQSESVEHGDN